MTPYQALYAREPNTLSKYAKTNNVSVDFELKQCEALLVQLEENLREAQAIMKALADRHRRDGSFNVGEWVWVKPHHYKQHNLAQRLNFKLFAHYVGLFQITKKIGAVAYKLKLSKVHPIFHVSVLKPFFGDPMFVTPSPLLGDYVLYQIKGSHVNNISHVNIG